MFPPGYYKTNYRALRFRELVRMQGRQRAFIGYLITRFKRPGDGNWMPQLWADSECRQEDISEYIWQGTKPYRLAFEQLGFTVYRYTKTTKSLSPRLRDSAGIYFLDPTRRVVGQLLYMRLAIQNLEDIRNTIVISFTALLEQGSLSCTTNQKAFDPPPGHEVIRLASHDVAHVYEQFRQHLQSRTQSPRTFPDLESLRQWHDARQVEAFEERVRRRLFLPMTDGEVAAARAQLQNPGTTIAATPQSHPVKLVFWLLLVGLILYLHFNSHRHPGAAKHHHGSDDTMEYQGQVFKLRKAYETYEDYKDDPDNLNTNELDRIEQTMISVKIPASFNSREDFIHTIIFDLCFPGYGCGGIGDWVKADDGSRLDAEMVEIPQRDKSRYIVVKSVGGRLLVVDDFVFNTSSNLISHVKLEKQKLHYFNADGKLLREKPL